MNKYLISLIGIILVTSIISLLAKFFDIDEMNYIPYMMWIIALFVFNIFLDKESSNIFMKDIQNV